MSRPVQKKRHQRASKSQAKTRNSGPARPVTDRKQDAEDIRRAVDDGMQDLRFRNPS